MPSRYLVTGGLGVIGSRFVESVCNAGHTATVVDAAEEPRNLWMEDFLNGRYPGRVTVLKQRVEKTDFGPLLASHDFLLHAAAHTGIPHSEEDPGDDWVSNVDASRHILEAMRTAGSTVPTVMLSSVKPYRVHDVPTKPAEDRTVWARSNFVGVDESFVLEPDEPYAASKMAQSALAISYARTYGLPVTVLRCSNLYGDAPCHGRRHGWLTWFCISAAMGWEIELQGTGLQTRDMLFSDDVATAAMAAFERIRLVQGNVYNIGGGPDNAISCRQSVGLLEDVSGSPVVWRPGPGRHNEDMLFITDFRKFSSVTGWVPAVSVREGVGRIYQWACAHREEMERLYGGT